MAAVLDPSFKLHYIRNLKLPANVENPLKQNIIQIILDEISKDLITSSDGSSSTATSFISSTLHFERSYSFLMIIVMAIQMLLRH
jgi:hypothetical protein